MLGSIVAVKLKGCAARSPHRMRFAPPTATPSRRRPTSDAARGGAGLSGATAKTFFSSLGVHGMGRYQIQAAFLEIDGPRQGMLTETTLVWYHGHIGRHLKRLIGKPTEPALA